MIKTYLLVICLVVSSCSVLWKDKFLQAFQWYPDVGEMFAKSRQDPRPHAVDILKTGPAARSYHTKQVTDEHGGCQLFWAVKHDQMPTKSLRNKQATFHVAFKNALIKNL